MIWTAITYNTNGEKIECKLYEAPMDFAKAYGAIASEAKGIVLSIIKGNHISGSYIPAINISLTRTDYRGEF
jgi:hypothetical protein